MQCQARCELEALADAGFEVLTAVCGVRVRALVAQHALCTNINNSGNSEHAEVSKTMIISLKRLQVTVNEL